MRPAVFRYGYEDHVEVAVALTGFDVAAPFALLHRTLTAFEAAAVREFSNLDAVAAAAEAAAGSAGAAPAPAPGEAEPGSFAVHPAFGYVTACPSRLGTALVATVGSVPVAHLRRTYTDKHIRDIAQPYGLNLTCGSSRSVTSSVASSGGGGDGDLDDEDGSDEDETSDGNGGGGGDGNGLLREETVDVSPTRSVFIREADIAVRLFHGARLLLLQDRAVAEKAAKANAAAAAAAAATAAAVAAEAEAAKVAASASVLAVSKEMAPAASVAVAAATVAAASERRQSALIGGMPLDAHARELLSFREALENGISVVKFNRRGKVAFRTLLLVGAHTLTWRSDNKKGSKRGGGGGGSFLGGPARKATGELFDLRELMCGAALCLPRALQLPRDWRCCRCSC